MVQGKVKNELYEKINKKGGRIAQAEGLSLEAAIRKAIEQMPEAKGVDLRDVMAYLDSPARIRRLNHYVSSGED
ncbi:hypothetical protein [Streptomyces sp. 4N124]|uniref:hypothetical protein n=1 Tax=Streptomyces sp. 4N124 TaxID=3457420 RepID=UPI003FD01ECD